MFIPVPIRRRILKELFSNGVLVVSSNHSAEHEELKCLNLYVFQIGRSFTDRGLCKKQYAWTHAYFTLTDKGVDYLREYFGAPASSVPAILNPRNAQKDVIERGGPRGGRGGPRGRGGLRGDHGSRERGGFRGRGRGGRGGPRGGEAGDAAAEPAQEE